MKILNWRGPCRVDLTDDTQEPAKDLTATVSEPAVNMYAFRTRYPYIVLPRSPTGEKVLNLVLDRNDETGERMPAGQIARAPLPVTIPICRAFPAHSGRRGSGAIHRARGDRP